MLVFRLLQAQLQFLFLLPRETSLTQLFAGSSSLSKGNGFSQLGVQIVGVLAFAIFSAVTSWIVWSVIGIIFGGIRVTPAEESEGLDIGEHGMEAYPDFASTK
jgi:Amt family ammonium transporter